MDVRRVVTGHDASGRSVFVSDDTVAPDVPLLMPDAEFHQLWGGDATPSFPDDGAKPAYRTYFAPIGGFRFGMFSLPPATNAGDQEVDVAAALEGTVVLELDDGAEVTLHPGDTVVQNGTRHRWHNPGDTTARVAVFMCGAAHSGIAPRR